MPRVASRITLEITSIKIERLHEITDEQAIKEGILNYTDETGRRFKDYTADATGYGNSEIDYPTVGIPVTSYRTLWDSINGIESWEENPFVWVIEFKRIK